MPIKFRCAACQTAVTAPDAAAGRSLRCPACKGGVTVPAANLDEMPPLPPPTLPPVPPTPAVANPNQGIALVGAIGGCLGVAAIGAVGVLLSQYAPLFGNPVALTIAPPFTPLRAMLAGSHFVVFGLAGAVVGGLGGVLVGYAGRDSLAGRSTLLAGLLALTFLTACAVGSSAGLLTYWGCRVIR